MPLVPISLRTVVPVSVDTGTHVPCEPREVFRAALLANAAAVILAHNHPSGDATPSTRDIDVTRRIAAAGRLLGIPLLDHLVVGDGSWTSLAGHCGTA